MSDRSGRAPSPCPHESLGRVGTDAPALGIDLPWTCHDCGATVVLPTEGLTVSAPARTPSPEESP